MMAKTLYGKQLLTSECICLHIFNEWGMIM